MGFETAEILEESGCEDHGEGVDVSGMLITQFSATVIGADINDPRLSDLCQFLQQLIRNLQADDTDMPVYANQESVDELLDILEGQVLTKFKLVFAWQDVVAQCVETGELSLLIQLIGYDHAPIFGYTLQ